MKNINSIYVVRHGEQGSIDLSQKGIEQALDAGMRLRDEIGSRSRIAVLASPELRATETADRIAQLVGAYAVQGTGYLGTKLDAVRQVLADIADGNFEDTLAEIAGSPVIVDTIIAVTHEPLLQALVYDGEQHHFANGEYIKLR